MNKRLAAVLGAVARSAREKAHLTQADVAERLSMTTEVYGRLERGLILPRVETLRRLSRVLGVSADSFLGLGEGAARTTSVAEPDASYGETPELRRLVRRLRRLSPSQIRLMGLIASELQRGSKD